ncbi:uncharacterized protein M421DRAFT_188422 [Didymella exigua CBS 183.55]|uniref:Uncharacterized protein n=1 Tax=Didymella exigua CBS 183.55 TaxID=1150837 RepID=A0A6A5RFC3_9PLEO|nr:uncharacterized protein M421DRAFT_188422 [Didymella exigua CBS 183.55]KAF1926981.1 hypothetical protein M421DRAFT_188422 [Didymella exigua CBS 183.55]
MFLPSFGSCNQTSAVCARSLHFVNSVLYFLLLEIKTAWVIRLLLLIMSKPLTYDHRTLKTRLPVRSALFKQRTGGLVVGWVTTSEYPLLYVFCQFCVIDVRR